MSNTQNLDELYKDGRIDEETYAINCIIANFQNEIKELKKENEELKEWKRNMKLFNGTDGIDSEEENGDMDDE
tara:strand:- start:1036 stop:1254 length:219 start_codon:yes stop_codon:yes gene_type:complete